MVTELDMKLRPLFMLTCSVADLRGDRVRRQVAPPVREGGAKYSRSFLLQDRSWTQEVGVSHHQGSFHCGDRTESNQTETAPETTFASTSSWNYPELQGRLLLL